MKICDKNVKRIQTSIRLLNAMRIQILSFCFYQLSSTDTDYLKFSNCLKKIFSEKKKDKLNAPSGQRGKVGYYICDDNIWDDCLCYITDDVIIRICLRLVR